jgi:hypothetical protein
MIRRHEKPRGRRTSLQEAPRIHRARERLQAHSIPVKITRILAFASLALASAIGLAAADPAPPPPNTPIGPLPPGATLRAATVRVIVSPDHRDWTYKAGETARFAVSVTADNEPVDGVAIAYTLGPDMFPG